MVTPFHLLNNKNYTTEDIRSYRYKTCLDCEKLFKPSRTCRECGCFMAIKTWIKDAYCPLGKWDKVE